MWPFRKSGGHADGLRADPAQGDPGARILISAAQRGDAAEIGQFLRGVDDLDYRSFYCRIVAEHAGDGAWLDAWAAGEPRSGTPLTMRGIRAVHWAWEARSSRRAKYVSETAFQTFFQRLEVAQEILDRAAALDRDDPTPWVWQITLGWALELGPDETRRRFDELRFRHPWNIQGHDSMLQSQCRKWGGSHHQMHDFAESAAASAPLGSGLGYLVALAHLENWLDLPDGEDAAYIQSVATRTRLRAAADRSVNHPDYLRRPGWAGGENAFAMAFSLNHDRSAAAGRFRALGDVVTEHPWDYLGEPGGAFAAARSEALA